MRRSLSKRVRFRVFARDDFTCGYCGRFPPAVTLEVDHIIPVIEGGGDEYENLLTSCFECNRGKAGIPLDARPPKRDLTREGAEVQEREDQLRAYNAVLAARRVRREQDFDDAWDFWFDLWGKTELERWHVPWEGSLRTAIETLGVEEVKEAMQIAHDRFPRLTVSAPKYFGGIIRTKIAQR